MWKDGAGKWLAQPAGIAALHAAAIGSDHHGQRNDKAAAVRLYVESLLSALPPRRSSSSSTSSTPMLPHHLPRQQR